MAAPSNAPHGHQATSAAIPTFGLERVLLLQGPMGPFFRRLADELARRSVRVVKVNLNAGDALYFRGPEARAFRGTAAEWPAYLARLVRAERIQGIFLFGDGRPLHRAAIELASQLGIRVFVFEEGYLRPDWITLEEGGVNGHSRMPRDGSLFRTWPRGEPAAPVVHVGVTFRYGAWYSTAYSLAMTLGFPFYPRYVHHRPLNAFAEAYRWVLGGARKVLYRMRERGAQEALIADGAPRFFLVALQVHCDYQLAHSSFATVESFLEHVVESFARDAPRDELLVVKHHPMDRPYRDYTRLLRELGERFGIAERLRYIHDQHLPTLLAHARGTVMINSTVGLQAALQGTPVKVLGSAVYDLPGITHQGPLASFWREPERVDPQVVAGFRAYLLAKNQHNGNFYKRLPGVDTPTGVRW